MAIFLIYKYVHLSCCQCVITGKHYIKKTIVDKLCITCTSNESNIPKVESSRMFKKNCRSPYNEHEQWEIIILYNK